jgi:hypothetical protein
MAANRMRLPIFQVWPGLFQPVLQFCFDEIKAADYKHPMIIAPMMQYLPLSKFFSQIGRMICGPFYFAGVEAMRGQA